MFGEIRRNIVKWQKKQKLVKLRQLKEYEHFVININMGDNENPVASIQCKMCHRKASILGMTRGKAIISNWTRHVVMCLGKRQDVTQKLDTYFSSPSPVRSPESASLNTSFSYDFIHKDDFMNEHSEVSEDTDEVFQKESTQAQGCFMCIIIVNIPSSGNKSEMLMCSSFDEQSQDVPKEMELTQTKGTTYLPSYVTSPHEIGNEFESSSEEVNLHARLDQDVPKEMERTQTKGDTCLPNYETSPHL